MPEQAHPGWMVVRPVPDRVKRLAVERIVASRAFRRSEQLQRLLHYLATRSLAGGATPSEREVAGQVLRRDGRYDPRTDSLVRKEMSRLRSKLAEYYQSEGRRDTVLVTHGGSYRLEFSWRAVAGQPHEAGPIRRLLVLPPQGEAGSGEVRQQVHVEILARLAGNQQFATVSRTTAQWLASLQGDIRDLCGQSGAETAVEMRLDPLEEDLQLILSLVDGISGFVKSTCRLRESGGVAKLAEAAAQWIGREESAVTSAHA